MDEDLLWELIASLDWKKSGDDDAVIEPVVAALATMRDQDIHRFDDIMAEKLHGLDGEKYAREIGEGAYAEDGYFSGDAFLYARACAVANGRERTTPMSRNRIMRPEAIPRVGVEMPVPARRK